MRRTALGNSTLRGLRAFAALTLCLFIRPNAQGDGPTIVRTTLERAGRINALRLREASGLARSRTQDGVFWSVTDSGGSPHIFALDRTGRLLAEYQVKEAVNLDWETIEADSRGNLYVGDTGNNLPLVGKMKVRFLYRLREPKLKREALDSIGQRAGDGGDIDKATVDLGVEELELDHRFGYQFPDDPFDVEALVIDGTTGLVIRKEGDRTARVYELNLSADTPMQTLKKLGRLDGVSRVTGADLSADGRRLALCGYDRTAIFERQVDQPLAAFFDAPPRIYRYPSTSIEGCAFDGDELILCDENRAMYRLKLAEQ